MSMEGVGDVKMVNRNTFHKVTDVGSFHLHGSACRHMDFSQGVKFSLCHY